MGLKSHTQSLSVSPAYTCHTQLSFILSVCVGTRSVVSHSLRPCGFNPPGSRPWDFPGKSTTVSHLLLPRNKTQPLQSPKGSHRQSKSTWRGTGADRFGPVVRRLPPIRPPGHLSEQNKSHLFTSSFPDSTRFPFLSGARPLLTNASASWASTPSAAASTGNTPRLLQFPGTYPRGTLLPRSAAGGPVLLNTARLRFLLTVRRRSGEQLLLLFFPALPASYLPPF